MNEFSYNLIKASRKRWSYTDKIDMAIFFFIDTDKEEDISRVINNINMFLNKNNDVYVITIIDIDIFKSFEGVKYFKVEGGYDPEKISSLISDKNIIVGVSSNISLNEGFVEYIDSNFFDGMVFFSGENFNNSILFVSSRDALSVKSYYKDSSLVRLREKIIPKDIFNIHHCNFKEKSYLDFKIIDEFGEEVDLYNNKIINSMWIGDSLSNVEKLCINTFLKNGHDFHLYVYDDIKGIPEGVVVKDANAIINSNKIFKYKTMCGREGDDIGNEGFAGFADWFRYALLYKKGGWWSDLDSICLKPFEILRPYFLTTCPIANSENGWYTNGIIKTPKNSLVMSFCINKCEEEGENVGWMDTGPSLLRLGYLHHNLVNFSMTEEVFDIYGSGKKIFIECSDFDVEGAYSVHMYNSELQIRGWDKNGVFPENSLFEQLKRKYL